MFVHFYDNNGQNCDTFRRCPYIIFNQVECNEQFRHERNINESEFANLIQNESKSVQRVASLYRHHHHYDILSGNKLVSGEGLFEHVERMCRSTNVSAFVFDWDRTLQPYESMRTQTFTFTKNKYGKRDFSRALAIYNAGGLERVQKIRRMFTIINNCHKKVCIVTGNPAILTKGRDMYKHILEEWGIIPVYLAYAHDKYAFMAQDKFLQSVSGPMLRY